MGEFIISQISKALKYLTYVLFTTTVLTFYDGHEYHDKFFVMKLTTSRSTFPLPKYFASIIVSLEVDLQDPTMQFWTTILTSSHEPIPSSEILREVTDKWCTHIVQSHLSFYQQQLWDYLWLPCSSRTRDGKNKHHNEFVEKTVRLLKLSLHGESAYLQGACENRLRKKIADEKVGQKFEYDLQKSYATCNTTGMIDSNNKVNVQPHELADCRQALINSEASVQQLNEALLKQQPPPMTETEAVIQLKEELICCKNTTIKLNKRIAKLRETVGNEEELANNLLREKLLREKQTNSKQANSKEIYSRSTSETMWLYGVIMRLSNIYSQIVKEGYINGHWWFRNENPEQGLQKSN